MRAQPERTGLFLQQKTVRPISYQDGLEENAFPGKRTQGCQEIVLSFERLRATEHPH